MLDFIEWLYQEKRLSSDQLYHGNTGEPVYPKRANSITTNKLALPTIYPHAEMPLSRRQELDKIYQSDKTKAQIPNYNPASQPVSQNLVDRVRQEILDKLPKANIDQLASIRKILA